MSVKQIGLYAGFFVLMLAVALVTTGVFQQNVLPRFSQPVKHEDGGKPGAEAAMKGTPTVHAPATPAVPSTTVSSVSGSGSVTGTPAESVKTPTPPAADRTGSAVPAEPRAEATPEAGAAVKRLSRMYEGMRPKEAAGVLEKLDRPLAAQMLGEINHRQAAKILAAMNPTVAAELTNHLRHTDAKVQP